MSHFSEIQDKWINDNIHRFSYGGRYSGKSKSRENWIKTILDKTPIRARKIMDTMAKYAEDAEIVLPTPQRVWWQLFPTQEPEPYIYEGLAYPKKRECFSVCVFKGIVVDAPNWNWKGWYEADQLRDWLIKNKYRAFKIN